MSWKEELAFVFVCAVVIVGVLLALYLLPPYWADQDCKQLTINSGRETRMTDGLCYIEIAPHMFVRKDEVVYYLDFVKPVDAIGEKE